MRQAPVSVAYEIVTSTPKTHQARVIDLDDGTVQQPRFKVNPVEGAKAPKKPSAEMVFRNASQIMTLAEELTSPPIRKGGGEGGRNGAFWCDSQVSPASDQARSSLYERSRLTSSTAESTSSPR